VRLLYVLALGEGYDNTSGRLSDGKGASDRAASPAGSCERHDDFQEGRLWTWSMAAFALACALVSADPMATREGDQVQGRCRMSVRHVTEQDRMGDIDQRPRLLSSYSIDHSVQALFMPSKLLLPPSDRFHHRLIHTIIRAAFPALLLSPSLLRRLRRLPDRKLLVLISIQIAAIAFTTPSSIRSKVLTEMRITLFARDLFPAYVAHHITTTADNFITATRLDEI
jgi:hypothetical protein